MNESHAEDWLQPGDWVCFVQLGMPCYGRVEYFLRNEIVTTAGTTRREDVLEVRRERRPLL